VVHLRLTGIALLLACAVAIPLALFLSRYERLSRALLYITGLVQTIPALALLMFMIPPLGTGMQPAMMALFLYSLLPIVRNTYTGLVEVDRGAVDAGLGMGMSRRQLLARVELPLALPLVFEGVRLAGVLLVGITALTALNGAGGLGFFIFEGINQAAPDLVLLGSLPTIALAVVLDQVLRLAARIAVPEGVRHP
jgi:osmoprotectant transport system permease protein